MIEKNKMILDFMGVKPGFNSFTNKWGWGDGIFFMTSSDTEEEVVESMSEYAKYNSDWNWIMKVVEEIGLRNFHDKNLMGIVTIHGLNRTSIRCYINEELINVIDCSGVSGIGSIYDACIEFIEWYNKNK
jgi:hypothetical protein